MGKNLGKTLISVAGFAFGMGGTGAWGWLGNGLGGAVGALSGGMMGLSLASTLWNATHKPTTPQTYTRFDQLTNNPSSEAMIPVIYCKARKWAGAQLWHKADKAGKKLTKDVLIGEGTIGGVYGVLANDLMVSDGAVMKLRNTDYSDATVTVITGHLKLCANGVTTDINLSSTQDDITYFDYNVNIGKLIAHIGKLGNGWVVSDPVSCSNLTTEIKVISATPCHSSAVSLEVKGLAGCSYTFHDGSATQEPPDNWETVGGYKNMAWLRVVLKQSSKLGGGNPTISYIVSGIKVLDTRTGIRSSSSNNAMCVRDFLLSKRYGIARFVPNIAGMLDEESFKEAADYCDELVNYKDSNGFTHSEPRYSLNIILDQKRNATEVLDELFASFGGFLVIANGKISLRCEMPVTSSYTFTKDTIVENSVTFEQLGIDETPNQYRIGYFDPSQNWTQVKCIVEDTIDQQPKPVGRGKVIPKELTLIGCTSQSQAIRLGRQQKLKNKLCSLKMSFKTTTFAMHLRPGDVINVTYSKVIDGIDTEVFTNMPWRILEISQQDGVWTLATQQYNESIYCDVTEEVQIIDYTIIQRSNYVFSDNPMFTTLPMVDSVAMAVITDIPSSLPADGGSADKLKTPRSINGVSFDGTADITIEDSRIDTGIKLRVNTLSLEASIDNGVTWRTLT